MRCIFAFPGVIAVSLALQSSSLHIRESELLSLLQSRHDEGMRLFSRAPPKSGGSGGGAGGSKSPSRSPSPQPVARPQSPSAAGRTSGASPSAGRDSQSSNRSRNPSTGSGTPIPPSAQGFPALRAASKSGQQIPMNNPTRPPGPLPKHSSLRAPLTASARGGSGSTQHTVAPPRSSTRRENRPLDIGSGLGRPTTRRENRPSDIGAGLTRPSTRRGTRPSDVIQVPPRPRTRRENRPSDVPPRQASSSSPERGGARRQGQGQTAEEQQRPRSRSRSPIPQQRSESRSGSPFGSTFGSPPRSPSPDSVPAAAARSSEAEQGGSLHPRARPQSHLSSLGSPHSSLSPPPSDGLKSSLSSHSTTSVSSMSSMSSFASSPGESNERGARSPWTIGRGRALSPEHSSDEDWRPGKAARQRGDL